MLTLQQKNNILRSMKCGLTRQQAADLAGVNIGSVTNLMRSRKRILCISDPHCGHVAGMCPPSQQWTGKFEKQQQEAWDWFTGLCKRLSPDVVVGVGDMIDGKGKRSGGSEQVSGSWRCQTNMAVELLLETGAKRAVLVYGTPYHTGDEEDFEDMITDKLTDKGVACTISGHEWLKVHDVIFDIKHKIGSSTIPHGRSTAIMKSKLWNTTWAERNQQPNSQVLLRGHVHYFDYVGNSQWLGMTMPALQGWGSKYGIRQCEGVVDFGVVWFDVYNGDTLDTLQWHYEIPQLKSHRVEVTKI